MIESMPSTQGFRDLVVWQRGMEFVTVFYAVTKHVPYYRVSTDRQGRSGLGLEAQQTAVNAYLAGVAGEFLAEFTEIESGKKADRPELQAAIDVCRKQQARLVIAKLDRLARNVHFVSGLMESGVDFVAADMPYANRLTIHIMAAVAEGERERISRRTKEALAAAKKRGKQRGNPRPAESLTKGRATIAAALAEHRDQVRPLVEQLRAQGFSLRAIARELNRRDIPPARGRRWEASTVRNVLNSLSA